jgi:drug/metabolite transporter (DMT)-like permease
MVSRLLLVLSAACWGISVPISTFLLSSIDPIPMLAWQLFGSILFLTCATLTSKESRSFLRNDLRSVGFKGLFLIVLLGVLEPGLAYLIGFYGMASTASSVSSIIIGVEPIFIVLANFALFGERLSTLKFALMSTCFVGVLLAVVSSSLSFESFSISGSFLVAVGTFIAALFVSISGRTVLSIPPTVVLVLSQASFVIQLALVDAIFLGGAIFHTAREASQSEVVKIMLAGSLQFGVSFWLFLLGVRSIGAQHSATYINLIPVFGIVFSIAIFREFPSGIFFLGSAMVIFSIYFFEKLEARQDKSTKS